MYFKRILRNPIVIQRCLATLKKIIGNQGLFKLNNVE